MSLVSRLLKRNKKNPDFRSSNRVYVVMRDDIIDGIFSTADYAAEYRKSIEDYADEKDLTMQIRLLAFAVDWKRK
jgi:hypothetical protein